MENQNNIPFPQANDFTKILAIIELESIDDVKNPTKLCEMFSVARRQVDYYVSACQFLGILDRKKNFTELGFRLREENFNYKRVLLAKAIISAPIFGEVFIMNYFTNKKMNVNEIAEIIHDRVDLPKIGVCKRRASTVISWLNWIDENKEFF